MVDMHAHIIYGVDDGSKSEEMTMEMLEMSKESGVNKIVATPHYMKGRFHVEFNEIKNMVHDINEKIKSRGLDIEVYCGQEVYYSENILEYYNNEEIGTINNSKYMLIEFPMREFNIDEIIENLYELTLLGIRPIIAHPERYIPFIKKPSLINSFIDEGYLFQLNTGSLVGDFGKDVKKLAETYLSNNIYSVIGSDAHSSTKRNTDIREFMKVITKSQIRNFKNNSEMILDNKEIEFMGQAVKEKKKFLGIF